MSLQEKLLEIEHISKASSRHVPRPPVKPVEEVKLQVKKPSGVPNYMVYQGKVKHCCKGRCMYGSMPIWSAFSIIFFNIPAFVLYTTLMPVKLAKCLIFL